ncbi:putative thioredoxin [Nemania diffusa]|nr:putative thioredoxin [Nemania diffusa]
MTNFSIDIVSDPVCPWCYIGKKRLDKAIALYQKVYPNGRADTFTVTWKAYYLDPSAPARGLPWEERALQKLAPTPPSAIPSASDRERVQQLRARLARIGQQEGVAFSFGGRIGNTRSAHRAIAFSKTQSDPHSNPALETETEESPAPAHDRFVMALFAAHFEGTADVTDHATLADVAASAGLDRARMLAWLDAGEGGDEVDAEDRAAKAAGLRGVPSFAVQGCRVDGAQDVQDFMELFVKIKEEELAREREGGDRRVTDGIAA